MSEDLISGKRNRIYYLDVLRVIAIVSISFNHAFNRSYDTFIYSEQFIGFFAFSPEYNVFKTIIYLFSRFGVPFFLMISGALLLRKKMDTAEDVKRFYRHNFLPLLIVTEVWLFLMYWFIVLTKPNCTILAESGIGGALLGMVKTMLFVDQVTLGSMWYMPMILCIYAVLPFWAMAVQRVKSPALWALPLGIVIVSGMLIPDLNGLLHLLGREDSLSFTLEYGNVFSRYLPYVFLGYFLSEGLLKNLSDGGLISVCAVGGAALCGYQLFAFSCTYDFLVSYESVGMLFCSVFFFELIRRKADLLKRFQKGITALSGMAFAIYFIHIVLMETIDWHIDMGFLSEPIAMLLLWSVSFFGSILLIRPLSKVPLFRKYLFLIKN